MNRDRLERYRRLRCLLGFSLRSSFKSPLLIAAFFLSSLYGTHSPLASEVPNELKNVGIQEHLGQTLKLSHRLLDERGQQVRLQDFFVKGRPVLVTLVYYECPSLCNFLLNGVVSSLRKMDWMPGKEFELVTISINPKETPSLAQQKKKNYLDSYLTDLNRSLGRADVEKGWHFLTGEETEIHEISQELGFGYKYDPVQKQYAHSAAIFILTPEGRISRYLYGVEFEPKDLRLALLEAGGGKIGSVVDRFLLFCYRYDSNKRKYSFYLENIMKTGGATTVVVFGAFLAVFWRRQYKEIHQKSERESTPHV